MKKRRHQSCGRGLTYHAAYIEQEELVEGRIVIGCGELADVLKEQMKKGLIDIGMLLESIDMEKFDFIRLEGKERWVVLMCPGDPLAADKFIEHLKCFLGIGRLGMTLTEITGQLNEEGKTKEQRIKILQKIRAQLLDHLDYMLYEMKKE